MGGVSQDVIDDTKDGDDASLVNLSWIRCEGGGEFGEGGSEGTGRGAAHIHRFYGPPDFMLWFQYLSCSAVP